MTIFPIFRVDISDTLMYVYEMLGAELLSNLYDRLGRQLMDPQQSAVWQVTVGTGEGQLWLVV